MAKSLIVAIAALAASMTVAGRVGGLSGVDLGKPIITVAGYGPAADPAPTPMPMPMPGGASVPSPSLSGLAPVASGLNVADYLVAAAGDGRLPPPEPGPPGVQVEGAFRFLCAPSHNAYDDPIVYPGQPGRSHLHTFFGNTKTNANSTYASLRTSGEGTCNNLLNRSAYWIPAMMNGQGKVVMPDWISIYYKRHSTTDPVCTFKAKGCLPLPRGLRYVFGYNMADPSKTTPGIMWFNCDGPGAVAGSYKNIAQAAKNCPVGARLGAVVVAPNCWNGTELDSPDHRSHMAYMGQDGYGHAVCPPTHPYILPQFQVGAWYTTDASLDRSGDESATAKTWYFSSDRMAGMPAMVPGSTFHSDWFGAWEDSVQAMWTNNCIEKMLSCSGGDLGTGKQLAPTSGYTYPNVTNLVDPPSSTPAPSPSPVGLHGVLSEGDSISVFYGGSYPGIYARNHPTVEWNGTAVGGSGIDNPSNGKGLVQRLAADLALKPAIVTVLIGANDLGNYPSSQAWLDALWSYVASVKATGAKVALGTVLPLCLPTVPAYTTLHNTRRAEVNAAIRAAVGSKIDAVFDFAADPVMGPDAAACDTRLYSDGTHPTDGTAVNGLDGQGKLAAVYTPVIDRLVAQ